MKGRCLAVALATALSLAGGAPASAESAHSAQAREGVATALREGDYSFCNKPREPITPRGQALCPLAADLPQCAGLRRACRLDDEAPAKEHSVLEAIMQALGPVAQILVWVLLGLIVIAVAIPVVRSLLRGGNAEKEKQATESLNLAAALVNNRPPPPPSDAEEALRRADEYARHGEYGRALSLYLAASLSALDRRGIIRLARHRTNGEYVRSCSEDASKIALREIVREVDRVEFGKLPPDPVRVAHVASRATALVRAALIGVAMIFVLSGCGDNNPFRAGDDPAGDELPRDLLKRSGYSVGRLGGSLATMPIPSAGTQAPLIVIDLSRVTLEEEAQAHLLRWVEAGGVLALFGPPGQWPKELGVERREGAWKDISVGDVKGARIARESGFSWPGSDAIARAGDAVYAARKHVGSGTVLGVASNDWLTNVGVMIPDNAAAFIALFDSFFVPGALEGFTEPLRTSSGAVDIRFAEHQDGIPPPDNPFAALVRAGLGKGTWHALAAALLLFLAYGIRHAKPRPTEQKPRRTFAEHVEATGAFYADARAQTLALAAYGRFVDMRLRERAPRGSDPVLFLAARADVNPAIARKLLMRALRAKPDDPLEGDELAVIRQLRLLLTAAERSS